MAVEDIDKLKGDKKIPTGILFKRTFKFVKPEIPRFIFAIILAIFNIVFDIIYPIFMEEITNELTGQARSITFLSTMESVTFIIVLAISLFVITLVSQACLYFEAMILQKSGQKIIYSLRMEVFQHIENMSQNQLDEMPVGSLVTRVANYTTSMSDLFTNIFVNLLKNTLTVIGVFIIMFTKQALLSLIMTGFLILIFIISFIFRQKVRQIFTVERRYISDLNAFLNENLSGMKIIQIFNQEIRKDTEFTEKNEALRRARMKVIFAYGLYRPSLTFIYYCAIATTFYCGMRFELSPGAVLAFYLYLSKFFNPIQNIADQLSGIQKATTASERLFNLLDVQPEVVDLPDAMEIDRFEGRIEFKNVWFAYNQEDWILKDVSFVIEPKQTCAFVGATGAGKTTILSLIVRNYEVQKGEILIDSINVKNIKINSLRKCIGQMLQDVFLFTGNIKDNITLHDNSYTDDEVMEVCRYVNADSFIDKMPKKLEEEVIERGENFSQGQRQLLSFARTVLAKPQVLILDEATANIDTETEVLIQESLEKIKNIGTMLVVAHRLSTIQKADQIIVLSHGEVIERGNHQELLKNKGYYYKLYQLQFENN